MNDVLLKLKNSMIVSCQSEGDDPFNEDPRYMTLFARAAEMGGARGIRTQGIEKIKCIKKTVTLPIIGLLKGVFEDGTVKITGSFSEVEQLLEVGCDIIAVDGTFRIRENLDGPHFIKECKKKYKCIILADIATFEEAVACEKAGADCVSTTLNGYTPDTFENVDGPNFDLLEKLLKNINIPVFAEGRYNTPSDVKIAMEMGAYAVISGTAITRPRIVTSWFVNAVNNGIKI